MTALRLQTGGRHQTSRKEESNDSPEIPDRGRASDIPGHPYGLAEASEDPVLSQVHC